MISIVTSIVLSDILKNYLIFQRVIEDSVLSGKLNKFNVKAKVTELYFTILKLVIQFVFYNLKLIF